MKKLLAMILMIAMILSLAACGGDEQNAGDPAQRETDSSPVSDVATVNHIVDSVTVGLKKASRDVAPFNGSGSSRAMMWRCLYDTLFSAPAFGATLEEHQPCIAKSVTFSDDNLSATVEIYDYVHDNQGNSIKASDVKFSYETACQSSTYTKVASYVDSVEAIDEYTVQINCKLAGIGTWEVVLTTIPIISQAWYEATDSDTMSNNPATTGCYYVASNNVGSEAHFAMVEDYWQTDEELRSCYDHVTVENIYFTCVVEDAMRTVAMQTGEIDLCVVANNDIDNFLGSDDYTILKVANDGSSTLLFNCGEGSVFDGNADLRKAILYAVDWEQARIAAGGTATAGGLCHDYCTICAGDYLEAWNDEDYFGYNEETALSYLADAGYDVNSGLTVRLMCTNDTYEGAAVVIKSCLAKIGIDVELDIYDSALFNTYLYDSTQWDIVLVSATTNGYVTDSWNKSFSVITDEGTLGFVKDDTLQQLLDAATSEHTEESLQAFHDYLKEMAYGMGMYYDETYYVAQNGITSISCGDTTNLSLLRCVFADDYESTARK